MFECFNSLGFTQFVNVATHSSTQSGNILDLILSNDSTCIDVHDVSAPLGSSDHSIVNFSITAVSNDLESTELSPGFEIVELYIYDWSAADYTAINDALEQIDWHSLFGYFFDADSLWKQFKTIIWPVIELYVPRKLVSHNKKYRPRNYPKHIRNLLNRKAAIWRKLRIDKSDVLTSEYRSISNECRLEIHKFDSMREEKLLNADNVGAFYKFVNNKLGTKSGIPPLKSDLIILLTSDIDKANLLNKYFESVFTKDDGNAPQFPCRLPNDKITEISDIKISPQI